MRAPTTKATMRRRILVNYRVEPAALASMLPQPFRPALVNGYGVAGICLIRLGGIRPAGVPAVVGVPSENAAHRVAVEWATGVYIPRRDTSSGLSALLGGRLFSGWQHRARFRVEECDGSYRVEMSSHDGKVEIAVAAHRADAVMAGSSSAASKRRRRSSGVRRWVTPPHRRPVSSMAWPSPPRGGPSSR